MSLGILLGFVFIVGGGIAFLCAAYAAVKKRKPSVIAGAAIGCVFALLLVTVPPSFHTVNAGEIAVVKHLGEAKNVREATMFPRDINRVSP